MLDKVPIAESLESRQEFFNSLEIAANHKPYEIHLPHEKLPRENHGILLCEKEFGKIYHVRDLFLIELLQVNNNGGINSP